ncbi:Helix-turn-helix domain-containing protein [Hymenobacter gelipurpurascens]|uniref:Helix-turn-helix domain-containing protein n=1 Tax=Hymenobacter gelipurpurascens TaxID=89968 RepID=A0A212TGP2_9BACT|nr:helix-turn-helix domain-containing protein [Hymenobacter gelipurpurascens]SNC65218.1 Helix-turn-helix domain-containing protein [Hymenobacter gelipurpurascens]
MQASETIDQFYQQQGSSAADPAQHVTTATGHFNVYNREHFCNRRMSYNRRDFYKIALMTGTGRLHYATRGVLLDRPALVFSNPNVPYAWEPISEDQGGYFCLFTEDFMTHDRSASLQESPLFKFSSDPVYFVNEEQQETISYLFRKMLQEMESGYLYKQDLQRTYVSLLIHEALKMQPQTTYFQHPNAASRIVALFLELLERQFPIDAPDHGLKLRTPGDFADRLAVHVNHLNRAVRELTGKTTGTHIAERIVVESKALLLHTTWSTAEIAYGLGFEYPTNFNTFYKKHTGSTPSALRALRS